MAKRQGKTKKSPQGRLRIVAGNWRSRLLEIADVPGLRPTSERVRETLFNWLAPHIAGARCLDLFAGTGALGLEALSRGAASVIFVETSAAAIRTLSKNIGLLDAGSATVEHREALDYLRSAPEERFDIVFVDPPFAADLVGETCHELAAHRVCTPGALVYIEDDRKRQLPDLPAGWETLKERTAGNVRYALLKTTSV